MGMKAFSGALARAVGVAAVVFATGFDAAAAASDVALADLPREARTTHVLILRGGPYPYPKDGVTFGNFENNLPRHKRGYYREFTVPTPGAKNRGARRIVCGAEARDWSRNAPDACWYTGDHYKTFQKIKG